jgi:hypothetical protein
MPRTATTWKSPRDRRRLKRLEETRVEGGRLLGIAPTALFVRSALEPGELADLVILDQNPLVDIHNTNTIDGVMKNGAW